MNASKLKKLFSAARHETPPELPFNFAQQVVAAIEKNSSRRPSASVLDQLGALFPRLAAVSMLVIVICLAGEYYMSAAENVANNDVTQVADELLLPDNAE